MPIRYFRARLLPIILVALVLMGCGSRGSSTAERRVPSSDAPACRMAESALAEARKSFTVGDRPIHPGMIHEFNTWFEDNGPVTVAVEIFPARGPARYMRAIARERGGWTECSVKSLWPHCWESAPTINEPMFGYRRLGVLADGTQVLRTYYCSGGSGIFMDLVFVRFAAERAYDGRMRPYARVVMSCPGVYDLGDRDDGTVQVLSDRVIVGPSTYREKEVVLKLE